jgi:aryl-alcohol dehydrogenase-like predicted oxidoreductase
MFPLVDTLGVGIMAYAPLGTGLLSGAYRADGAPPPPDTLWGGRRREHFAQTVRGRPSDVLTAVREVSARSGASAAQVALRWVLSHPAITVAISGADNENQIEENVGATSAALSPEDLRQLTDASAGLSMPLDGPPYN